MRRIVLASHHRFAEGLAATMNFIGNIEGIEVICAYVDQTPLEDQVAELFSRFDADDEVLVMTDIIQGSVNQKFVPYLNDHVFLVAGVNVPLALELAFAAEPLTTADIEACIAAAQDSIKLINTLQLDEDDDDE